MTETLVRLAILSGLVFISLMAALFVFRGQRFWAPVMMFAATGLFTVTTGINTGIIFYFEKKREALALMGGTYYESDEWTRLYHLGDVLALVTGGVIALCFILYGIGLWGVASRWKEAARRAKELEMKTAELAALRDSGLG